MAQLPWLPKRVLPAENDGCSGFNCFMQKEWLKCQVADLEKKLAVVRAELAARS